MILAPFIVYLFLYSLPQITGWYTISPFDFLNPGQPIPADPFVIMDFIVMKGWVLYPLAFFLFANFSDNLSNQFTIRKTFRSQILIGEIIKVVLLSIYMTVVKVVSIELVCLGICNVKVNWTQRYTVFWLFTEKTMSENPSYGLVIACFCLSTVTGYLILGLIYLLVGYCCNQRNLAFLIGIIVVVLRIGLRDYVGQAGIQYDQWLEWDVKKSVFKLVLVIGMVLMGIKLIKRKDYYGS